METRNVRRTLFWMVATGLTLRFIVMCFVYQQNLDPATGHWSFGFEEGRVARPMPPGKDLAIRWTQRPDRMVCAHLSQDARKS